MNYKPFGTPNTNNKTMRRILEFRNEKEYLEWQSIEGNIIHTIQDSNGNMIGELKQNDLTTLWDSGRIVSFDNTYGFLAEAFITTNFECYSANWGIVNDCDSKVLNKLVHINIIDKNE